MQLSEVRAVISGGASGLGFAAAQRLVDGGAKVALIDINDEQGANAAAELGRDAQYIHADVTSEGSIVEAMATAMSKLGGLNVALNCAGVLGAGRVLGKGGPMPLSKFETAIKINLVGSFNMAKAASNLMQHGAPGVDGERGGANRTSSLRSLKGRPSRHDAADGARTQPLRHPCHDRRSRYLLNSDGRRYARRGTSITLGPSALPFSLGQTQRVRRCGRVHHRQSLHERRMPAPGWRSAAAA